ncbi:hypothetical protein ACEU2D_19945 [Brevibacillus laterosporus]|uniref:hypothetical protein n=1 Tax=Brevibacillus laterosporus TaxID=1465 RepID=UPI0035A6C70D
MISLDQWTPEAIEEHLIKQDEKLRIAQLKRSDMVSRQVKVFERVAEKLSSAINFFKERQHSFVHPENLAHSDLGPVVGYDNQTSTLYVYDNEINYVFKINRYNKEQTTISIEEFLEEQDFDIAIAGLLKVLSLHEHYIQKIDSDTEKRYHSVEKYKFF